jgi:alpha-tubulin suppressor-like RCC1 family protein
LNNGVVIYAGERHVGKTREDKKAESRGHYRFSILQMPDNKPVSFLATGKNHVVLICSGKLYAMGDNSYKQLGIVRHHY